MEGLSSLMGFYHEEMSKESFIEPHEADSWCMMNWSPTKMRWSKGGWIGDIKVVVTSFNVFGTAYIRGVLTVFVRRELEYVYESDWEQQWWILGATSDDHHRFPRHHDHPLPFLSIISPCHLLILSSSHPSYVIVIGIVDVDTSTAQRDVKNTNTRTVSPLFAARYPHGRALRVRDGSKPTIPGWWFGTWILFSNSYMG